MQSHGLDTADGYTRAHVDSNSQATSSLTDKLVLRLPRLFPACLSLCSEYADVGTALTSRPVNPRLGRLAGSVGRGPGTSAWDMIGGRNTFPVSRNKTQLGGTSWPLSKRGVPTPLINPCPNPRVVYREPLFKLRL